MEPLRRGGKVKLHPTLVNAALVYEDEGRQELHALYQSYISVAVQSDLPLLLCTPTWRANQERVAEAGVPASINRDAMACLREVHGEGGAIRFGGLIGCKNDGYKPQEGLSSEEAEQFHTWQINEFAEAGSDYLIAETICTVTEAVGIARAMENTSVPYIISFVIGRDGRILDGSTLYEGILKVQDAVTRQPLGFMVNCAWPGFLNPTNQPVELWRHLIGFQANGSSLDHAELDNATELQSEEVAVWGEAMLELNRTYGVPILGGCCGTGVEHLRYLVSA